MIPPYRTILQFIVAAITGIVIGKKVNIQVMNNQQTEIILIARPYLPRFHGPIFNGLFVALRQASNDIGIAYEPQKPATRRETMALNATLEPMLIRLNNNEMIAVSKIDHNGRRVLGCTIKISLFCLQCNYTYPS